MKYLYSLIAILCLTLVASADSTLTQTEQAIEAKLNAHTTVKFAKQGKRLLGLQQLTINGVETTSADTVVRPLIAQEWEKDMQLWFHMELAKAEMKDGKLVITANLFSTTEEQAYRDAFLMKGQPKKAIEAGLPAPLAKLKTQSEAAKAKIAKAVEAHEEMKAMKTKMAELQKEVDNKTKKANKSRKQLRGYNRKRLPQLTKKLTTEITNSAAFASEKAVIAEYKSKLGELALKDFATIHRDYYNFALNRLPAEICAIPFVNESFAKDEASLKTSGTLTWVVEPVAKNIAGWAWHGIKHHYSFKLADGEKTNVFRTFSTWELDGNPDGTTLVALRYRGLGNIEQKLTAKEDGGIAQAWTTTEVLPGAVGGAPLISPVVPTSKDINDRGYALQHRVGAWISKLGRGAGSAFVDYQFKPHASMAVYYERQGSLRAVAEVMPGDKVVSHSDEEFFKLTDAHTTIPKYVIALVNKEKPLTLEENRTRWKEVDQFVRDRVSEQLGFVQHEVQPGVGLLSDYGWAGHYTFMAKRGVKEWHDIGVRFIAYHNPGYPNGRYQGPKGDPSTPKDIGGGVCDIYDWAPTIDVVEPWKAFQKACAEHQVAYFPWIGQTIQVGGAFTNRVGKEKENWALNGPFESHGHGYGADTAKGNIANENFRKHFLSAMEKLHKEQGYQGFWVDSYQNLFMSQLNWAEGTGESLQEAWWQEIAKWSRNGIAWMSESHSFPGMSCSIEVQNWKKDMWYFQHVWKWLRGPSQNAYSNEQLTSMVFFAMANKGWVAPDHSYKANANFAIKDFDRLAHEQLAVRLMMRRPYILPNGQGVLWLPYDGNGKGALFAIKDVKLPEGVKLKYAGKDKYKQSKIVKEHTYIVEAKDLIKAFNLRSGSLEDPRVGREYVEPTYSWPVK